MCSWAGKSFVLKLAILLSFDVKISFLLKVTVTEGCRYHIRVTALF